MGTLAFRRRLMTSVDPEPPGVLTSTSARARDAATAVKRRRVLGLKDSMPETMNAAVSSLESKI